MRSLVQLVVASATLISIVACTDERKDLLAPPTASSSLVPIGTVSPPVRLVPYDPYVDVVAGSNFSCVRKSSGTVLCWGWGSPTMTKPGPVYTPIGQLPIASQLVAAGSHICALITGMASAPEGTLGDLYCQGGNEYGQFGLGLQTIYAPVYDGYFQKRGTKQYWTIQVGLYETCGTNGDGVSCMGFNGDPNAWFNQAPTLRTDLRLENLSVGMGNVCGYIVNLAAMCWGYNNKGQSMAPFSQLSSYVQPGRWVTFSSAPVHMSSYKDFMCADLSSGVVQCVGSNDNGTLGVGTFGYPTESYIPQSVISTSPIGAMGVRLLHGVSAGDAHACALDHNGAAWCWGNDFWGQLGNGINLPGPNPYFPTAQLIATVNNATPTFTKIAAGGRHTCAIGTDGGVWCWGDNSQGQIGTVLVSPTGQVGTFTNKPVKIL